MSDYTIVREGWAVPRHRHRLPVPGQHPDGTIIRCSCGRRYQYGLAITGVFVKWHRLTPVYRDWWRTASAADVLVVLFWVLALAGLVLLALDCVDDAIWAAGGALLVGIGWFYAKKIFRPTGGSQ